jgi:menaquinol-cytochrome c reductase iron-sulfur subunit
MSKPEDPPPGSPGSSDRDPPPPGSPGSPDPVDLPPEPEKKWPQVCEERRKLLAALTLGIGAVAGTSLLAPWLGLFVTPLARTDPTVWREVGAATDFPIGKTVQVTYLDSQPLPWAGFAARNSAWIRREGPDEFAAFTTYCSHVGCAVRWEEGAGLFLCPCHGGAFYADGSVAAGPPPRPLDRYPIRVRNGQVEIRAEGLPSPQG